MKKRKILVVTTVLFGILLYFWGMRHERAFIYKLQEEVEAGRTRVDITNILDGDWELMCFSHPYDGPLHLEKYDRTYPAIADAQDGAWGFLFIRSDGSYEAISGSRRDGFEFDPSLVCTERKNAKFEFIPSLKKWVYVG